MCLIRVRIDLQWIFKIKKRIEFIKTIRLSTHIDIFVEKKKFKFFFGNGGSKSKNLFFDSMMWNCPKNSFVTFNWSKNAQSGVFWLNFVYKSHFGDLIDLQIIFLIHHWIFLVKTLRLSTHMPIFKIIIFLIKKVAKLVETQKFCHHRLNHLFLHRVSYSQFFIWWKLRKLVFFGLFWGVSNGKLFVTPPGKNWKKMSSKCCT